MEDSFRLLISKRLLMSKRDWMFIEVVSRLEEYLWGANDTCGLSDT